MVAGFRRAVTPANDLRIGDLYLVPAERALTRFCRVGAARAHIPVPCPTRVPAPSGSVIDCGGATPCATPGRFVLEGDFTGPLGYVGAGNGAGHLWFLAATPRNRDLIECGGAEPLSGRVSILERRATWLECPPGSELNSGHVLLEWRRENVVYVVSVHGVTPLNRRLTVALARQVRFVR